VLTKGEKKFGRGNGEVDAMSSSAFQTKKKELQPNGGSGRVRGGVFPITLESKIAGDGGIQV